MTDGEDPRRLGEAADGSAAARLLEVCRKDLGDEAHLARLEARLAPLLWTPGASSGSSGSGGAGGATSGAAAGGGVSAGVKLATTIALVLAVGGGALLLRVPGPGARPAEPRAASRPVVPPVDRPGQVTAGTGEPPAEVHPLADPGPATVSAARPGSALPRDTETSLLDAAQAALTSSPARALALTEAHRRRFPSGHLAEEREVLAVDALARLGRRGEAAERARRFGASHPGSAYRSKVEDAIRPR